MTLSLLTFPTIILMNTFYSSPPCCVEKLNRTIFGCVFGILSFFFSYSVQSQVSGKVFNDYNASATQTSATAEPGVAGVVVTAIKPDGTSYSDTTDALGAFSFTATQIPSGTKVRLEYHHFPTDTYDGTYGATAGNSGTSVQFVTAATTMTTANLGLSIPSKFCQANPLLATPCYVNGNPLGGGTAGTLDSFVGFDFNSSGNASGIALGTMPTDPVNYHLANSLIGTTWGVAYARKSQKIYTSAFVKRHTGVGPLGEGGIYVISNAKSAAPTVSNFIDVNTIGINTGTVGVGATPALRNVNRGLSASGTGATSGGDPLAFDAVGKVGLGNLEISEDEKKLWVINLNNQTLNSIVIDSDNNPSTAPTSADVQTYSIPNPFSSGNQRPFALKVYNGKVYVGMVSDAVLEAAVYSFDGTSFSPVSISGQTIIPLNYTKGFASINCATIKGWYNWRSTYPPIFCDGTNAAAVLYSYPTPVLSDIEFDEDGSMILAFFDRMGHQIGADNTQLDGTGTENYHAGGDILRVCNVGGSFILQGGTGCSVKLANAAGPGGGEYYYKDEFNENTSYVNGTRGVIHSETVVGGLASPVGSGEVAVTSFDPSGTFYLSGGVNFFNNSTGGVRALNYLLYVGDPAYGTGGFSKANGLGDLEVLCDLPTIEIGNRIWNDNDKNGIQDPDEAALVGVTVSLYDSTGVLVPNATVVTDANGQFIFSSATGTSTANIKYGLAINPLTKYQIKIDALGTNASVTGLALTDVSPSTPGESASVNSGVTISNNDAKLISGKPTVIFTTGNLGQHNHTYDLALACTAPVVTATVFTQATCPASGITANNNASIKITTNGDKAAISVTGTPTTAYASATAVSAGNVTFSSINGTVDSLYVRIFKGANCYLDTIFVVTTPRCCPAITFGTPTNYTAYCSSTTIPTLTASTNAISPDSIRFFLHNTKQTLYSDVLNGIPLGKVKITGTATTVTNTATLTNVVLPQYIGAANDTLYIYAVYVDRTGDTTCKIFAEKPIIIKPEPVASITGVSTVCNSTAITLSSEVATSYKWGKVGSATILGTAQTYTVTPPINATTTYWLLNTNSSSCVSDTVYQSVTTSAGILGTVYRDFNSNGIKEGTETTGVQGIKVYAYDCNGTKIDSTTTDEFGRYAFTSITAATGKVRIEFSKASMPSWLQESYAGTNNGTDVQFVTAPNCSVDWALKEIGEYCQNNPRLITTCFVNGTAIATSTPNDVIVSFGYLASGTSAAVVTEAVKNQTGAVWGLAYNRTEQKIYSATFLKRHVGIKGSLGDIYVSNLGTPTDATLFTTIPNAGTIPTDATRGVGAVGGQSLDVEAFGKVGRAGLGGLSFSEDEKTLYTVNLNDKKLYSIDMATKVATGITIPTICDLTKGQQVPFAVKTWRGKIYVGVVCDASISKNRADLKSHVLVYDPSTSSFAPSPVLSVNMDYTRGIAWNNTGYTFSGQSAAALSNRWYPWVDSYVTADLMVFKQSGDTRDLISHPTPILSDIEFDTQGNMILGYMDRIGHQFGDANRTPTNSTNEAVITGGDILKANLQSTGTWTIESTIATGGEFFKQESYLPAGGVSADHQETSHGGIYYSPQNNLVALTAMDPVGYTSGGVIYLSNSTGNQTQSGLQLYVSNTPAYFGKGSGIGDITALCNVAPIQIGNYIWLDADKDGVQDPCELPAVGVKVYLYTKAGVVKDSTTTDANGNWYFSSTTDSIKTNTAYYVVLGGASQFNKTEGSLTLSSTKYAITKVNSGVGINADQNDSDAQTTLSGLPLMLQGLPVICDTTGGAGYINHTLDVGLVPYVPYGSIGDFVWKDSNDNGIQDVGEAGVKNVKLYLLNGTTGAKLDSSLTDNTGKYLFDSLISGSYKVQIALATLPISCILSKKPNLGTDDSKDSDFGTAGISQLITINTTKTATDTLRNNPNIDAGLIPLKKGSLGDFIWKDTNDNGIQESGEAGQVGVIVELYKNGSTTGLKDTTDVNGNYLFTQLDSASYQVKIITTSLLPSCALSTKQNTTSDGLDNDFNATTGLSDAVVVDPYSSDTNKVNIRTVDGALIYVCIAPTVGMITASQATCIGGTANADASVNVTGISGADKYSFGTSTSSFSYASATSLTGATLSVGGLTNPNATTLYYVRVYNGTGTCYTTVSVNLVPKSCTAPCPVGVTCVSIGVKKN